MFHPREQQIPLDTIFPHIDLPTYFHGISTQEHSSNLKRYFSLIFEEKFIGVPYTDLCSTKNELYLDPRIVSYFQNSSGMAAGNSYEEAVVQGLSEYFEHIVREDLFTNYKDKTFYAVNLSKLSLPQCI